MENELAQLIMLAQSSCEPRKICENHIPQSDTLIGTYGQISGRS
jgi:hypothetical protein